MNVGIEEKKETTSELIKITDEFHRDFLLLGLGGGKILLILEKNTESSLDEISKIVNEKTSALKTIIHEMEERKWIELTGDMIKITNDGKEILQHYKTIKNYFSSIDEIPDELSKKIRPVKTNAIKFWTSFFKETFEHPTKKSVISNETGEVLMRE